MSMSNADSSCATSSVQRSLSLRRSSSCSESVARCSVDLLSESRSCSLTLRRLRAQQLERLRGGGHFGGGGMLRGHLGRIFELPARYPPDCRLSTICSSATQSGHCHRQGGRAPTRKRGLSPPPSAHPRKRRPGPASTPPQATRLVQAHAEVRPTHDQPKVVEGGVVHHVATVVEQGAVARDVTQVQHYPLVVEGSAAG